MRFLVICALLLGVPAPASAQGSSSIPPGLKGLKPHEIVEQVADEPHRFKHDPTKKPHDVTHVPMIGSQEAFDRTVAILTPDQQGQFATLFAKKP